MQMIAWKAWYQGGRSYCSSGTLWSELPDDGALGFVILFDVLSPDGERYRRFVSGSDLYWMVELEEQQTLCQGMHGDRPAERYPGAVIKRGAWTSDDEMQRVNAEMANWRG